MKNKLYKIGGGALILVTLLPFQAGASFFSDGVPTQSRVAPIINPAVQSGTPVPRTIIGGFFSQGRVPTTTPVSTTRVPVICEHTEAPEGMYWLSFNQFTCDD